LPLDLISLGGDVVEVRLAMAVRPPQIRRRKAKFGVAASDDRTHIADVKAGSVRQGRGDPDDSFVALEACSHSEWNLARREPRRAPQADDRRSRGEAWGSSVQSRSEPAEVVARRHLLPPTGARLSLHFELGRQRAAMNFDPVIPGSERHLDRHPHRARFRDYRAIYADRRQSGDAVEAKHPVDRRVERGRESRVDVVTERDRSRSPSLDLYAH
jgi:hypothetical protein